jgi:hypothetical protein
MSRKQYVAALAAMVVSGFVGGAAAAWLLTPRAALAQGQPADAAKGEEITAKEVKATRFLVVDENGDVRGALGLAPDPERGCGLGIGAPDGGGVMVWASKEDCFVSVGAFRGQEGYAARLIADGDSAEVEITDEKGRVVSKPRSKG